MVAETLDQQHRSNHRDHFNSVTSHSLQPHLRSKLATSFFIAILAEFSTGTTHQTFPVWHRVHPQLAEL